jgi:hypothetical protein
MRQKDLTVFEMKYRLKAKWKNVLIQINQRSILAELRTALCTMTVNMEAPRSGQAGLEISKPSDFLAHSVHSQLEVFNTLGILSLFMAVISGH